MFQAEANLKAVSERISRACDSAQRDPADVTLVVVSKSQPIDKLRAFYDLGVREFGESRLQEAQPKVETLPGDIRWHFIGHLQSNKARKVAALFDVIHTIYRDTQLEEIEKSRRTLDALVEINIASEPQKSGIELANVDAFWKKHLEWKQTRFRGLMTVGPVSSDPEAMRPYFRALREANEAIGGTWLSMGMSHDFEIAIQEGSTHVRVGSALFGQR